MDFDEYIEKEVENLEPQKLKATGSVKSEEKDRSRSSKHRSNEKEDDSYRRSKRAKSGEESRDRDRDRERVPRHRSSPRDKDEERSERDRHRSGREHRDREKGRDKEERNGKDRDEGIDRERDRNRDRRHREPDYESERGGERERERSHRSRSHSERHRDEDDRGKTRDRKRNGEMEYREKEKEREPREMDRESSYTFVRWSNHFNPESFPAGLWRYKEKKEEVKEPEIDPDRDQRTVFAYQISLKADEKDVYTFFSRAGKVRDVRLIMDRNSRRSKGVGYIEFYEVMSVPMAIALSGQPLLGQAVMVKPSEAEKNLVPSTASAAGGAGGITGPHSGGARRLYVGNLHLNMKEDHLRQDHTWGYLLIMKQSEEKVFEPFGTVELVQLPTDTETGYCKGYGFVQFARLEDARAALQLNGLEIAGRTIKVSANTDPAGMQDIGVNSGELDDDEGSGLSLNARSRALLMQKLDRTGTASSITGSLVTPVVNSSGLAPPILGLAPAIAGLPSIGLSVPAVTLPSVDVVGVPSECLLLKNMFDPQLETELDFDLDIKDDVKDECSKFGALKHIYVDKNTAGFVYLRFENTQFAMSAQRALHGRWFAGKMITATFMLPQTYEAKFPDSR
ncbi:hypothetical protein RJ639_013257 [Escallonia herrerae]|uniref:RRM domain-containing protein n=1 Tax=Escallonia herrerae TaxID=1293975 RepID=A0AA88VKJ3_9ASTE|nr:hypothetical protein RJ639_013257 [Escallonia herrerae]